MIRYQDLLPAHTPAELRRLRTSIQKHGVLTPITVDQHGNIIDGHTRAQIASELSIECRREIHPVRDESEAALLALALNLERRHLSKRQQQEIVAKVRKYTKASQSEAAAIVGVTQQTVSNWESKSPAHTKVSNSGPPVARMSRTRPHRISPDESQEIRTRRARGESVSEVARALGVSRSTVQHYQKPSAAGRELDREAQEIAHWLVQLWGLARAVERDLSDESAAIYRAVEINRAQLDEWLEALDKWAQFSRKLRKAIHGERGVAELPHLDENGTET